MPLWLDKIQPVGIGACLELSINKCVLFHCLLLVSHDMTGYLFPGNAEEHKYDFFSSISSFINYVPPHATQMSIESLFLNTSIITWMAKGRTTDEAEWHSAVISNYSMWHSISMPSSFLMTLLRLETLGFSRSLNNLENALGVSPPSKLFHISSNGSVRGASFMRMPNYWSGPLSCSCSS